MSFRRMRNRLTAWCQSAVSTQSRKNSTLLFGEQVRRKCFELASWILTLRGLVKTFLSQLLWRFVSVMDNGVI